jgi:hypothetical protein
VTDEEARLALEALIVERREDYAGLSRLLGRNPAYVQQYVKRGSPRRLAERDRQLLARYFGVGEDRLGGPPLVATPPAPARPARRTRPDVVMVPRLRLEASAGPGREVADERRGPPLPFAAATLRDMGAAGVEALSLVRVQGDSMLPTLADGDDILVDTKDAADRLREGVYVLRLGDGLLVKRIAVAPGGALSVLSDNPAGPRWTDVDRREVHVIGRVLWSGGPVR